MCCVSLTFVSGCTAFRDWWHGVITDEASLTRICATTEGISKTGTIMLVSKVPEAKEPMLIVVNSIEVLAQTDEGVKPDVIEAEIRKALDGTSCDQSVKDAIINVTDTVLLFYKAVYKANIETHIGDVGKGYIRIVGAMCTGIREGCGGLAGDMTIKAYIPAECYKPEDYIFAR